MVGMFYLDTILCLVPIMAEITRKETLRSIEAIKGSIIVEIGELWKYYDNNYYRNKNSQKSN